MTSEVHKEDPLVIDVQEVLERYRTPDLMALAFAGTIGREASGTFTWSTAGSCHTANELHAFLSDEATLQTALRVAELLARQETHAFLRALACCEAPPALDDSTTQSLAELGIVEASGESTWRLSPSGQFLYLVFFSIVRCAPSR